MNLRSLSIAVPTKGLGKNGRGCPNSCMFCVSAMDDTVYPNIIEGNDLLSDRDYLNRINFCLERNFESLILTGTGEPLINFSFLNRVAAWNKLAIKPFRWIDIQTSGITLNDGNLTFLRQILGVTTISLSLSSIFNSDINAQINNTPDKLKFSIPDLCSAIKKYGFNLRLSLNMWSHYNNVSPDSIFLAAKNLGANQITFRQLYTSGDASIPQNKWISEHAYTGIAKLNKFIEQGEKLEKVSFGATRYDVQGLSTLLDLDCMSTSSNDDIRYLILRPDCHLYTKWNRVGSLLF